MSPGTPRVTVGGHDEACAVFEAGPDGGPSLKPCDCRTLGLAPECTGLAASWCPVCGDCKCPDRELGDINDPDCPLHNNSSDHAEPVGDSR